MLLGSAAYAGYHVALNSTQRYNKLTQANIKSMPYNVMLIYTGRANILDGWEVRFTRAATLPETFPGDITS